MSAQEIFENHFLNEEEKVRNTMTIRERMEPCCNFFSWDVSRKCQPRPSCYKPQWLFETEWDLVATSSSGLYVVSVNQDIHAISTIPERYEDCNISQCLNNSSNFRTGVHSKKTTQCVNKQALLDQIDSDFRVRIVLPHDGPGRLNWDVWRKIAFALNRYIWWKRTIWSLTATPSWSRLIS